MWGKYVPVGRRLSNMRTLLGKRKKNGLKVRPIEIEGRKIAKNFWGLRWCEHLESFADFRNRLPRGRTYVRNGSVGHLEIGRGRVSAVVAGSRTYEISVSIEKLPKSEWERVKSLCAGQISSALELLQGKLSKQVMGIVTNREKGLFPQPKQIKMKCSCPDWATMCKHVAAVLYGVGSRLDRSPEELFVLRGVDPRELIRADLDLAAPAATPDGLEEDDLSAIFGVDIEDTNEKPVVRTRASGTARQTPARKRTRRTSRTRQARDSARRPPRMPLQPSAAWINRLRERLDLSENEFARQLGVVPATVKRWLSATGPLTLNKRSREALRRLNQRSVS